MLNDAYPGLDLLSAAVVLVDRDRRIVYANPAAENMFGLSSRNAVGKALDDVFVDAGPLLGTIDYSVTHDCSHTGHDLAIGTPGQDLLHVAGTATPVHSGGGGYVLIEFRQIDQALRIAREERVLDQTLANRELIRNLAHEIRNPLGGIRGAAQLLSRELDRVELGEYTRVIMQEADRLQSLMDRLLTPHRLPQRGAINIHEVLERVRSVMLAEIPEGIEILRDYDVSLPELTGDKEQIIQVLLNIVRNAAQALKGRGRIDLRTRIVRQVTVARKRHRHAVQIQVIDNGPGIPDDIRDRVFYPLVSGREGGTGLGLSIAQTYVAQHHGSIEVESRPGRTCFTILLPVGEPDERPGRAAP